MCVSKKNGFDIFDWGRAGCRFFGGWSNIDRMRVKSCE
jgi:hypothetical protein